MVRWAVSFRVCDPLYRLMCLPWDHHRYRLFVHRVRIPSRLRIRPQLRPATGRRAVGEHCKTLLLWKRRGPCEYSRLHRAAYRRRRVNVSDRRRVTCMPLRPIRLRRGPVANGRRVCTSRGPTSYFGTVNQGAVLARLGSVGSSLSAVLGVRATLS